MIKFNILLQFDPVSPQEEAIGVLLALFMLFVVLGFIWGGGCLIKKAIEMKKVNSNKEPDENIDNNEE